MPALARDPSLGLAELTSRLTMSLGQPVVPSTHHLAGGWLHGFHNRRGREGRNGLLKQLHRFGSPLRPSRPLRSNRRSNQLRIAIEAALYVRIGIALLDRNREVHIGAIDTAAASGVVPGWEDRLRIQAIT